jgi:hypothetical protein
MQIVIARPQAENQGEIVGAVGAQRRGALRAPRTPDFADHSTRPEQLLRVI